MKIGILTFHRAHNYGAVLQCYALQEVLKGMGHEVEVIDYRQPWIEGFYSLFKFPTFNKQYPGFLDKLRYIKNLKWRKNIVDNKRIIFNDFINNNLQQSDKCKNMDDLRYDAIIIGSDQLWSPSCLGNQFDEIYLGYFSHNQSTKVIGFSISSNSNSIKRLDLEYNINKITKNFSSISFREKEVAKLVGEIIGRQIPVTIDPTLLTSSEQWDKLIDKNWSNKKYVVIYQIRTSDLSTENLYKNANKYITLHPDCSIVDLSHFSYSVRDFVSIIKYAQFVFTTSFHATAFSIIFKVPFYAFKLNDGHDVRYVDLLHTLGLTLCIKDIKETELDYDNPYNHKSVCDKLIALQKDSYHYLSSSLH